MPLFGLSIEKTVSFRGAAQPFANVYYYDSAGSSPSDADLETLLDQCVAQEKTFHATTISFVRGRVWSAGGSEAANQMRVDKALSGAGVLANSTSMDRERAVLVRWRAGIDSRGRPVYLRKWWHVCTDSVGGAGSITSAMMAQTAQIPQVNRDAFETTADFFLTRTVGGTVFTLRSSQNRPVSGSTECHPYLEHHQLGDQWRSL